MDIFPALVCGLIAIAMALPWLFILMIPLALIVFVVLITVVETKRFLWMGLQFWTFKMKLRNTLLRHLQFFAQPKKVCACYFVRNERIHVGVQFSTANGSWSHHVEAATYSAASARLQNRLMHSHLQNGAIQPRPCVHQFACPNQSATKIRAIEIVREHLPTHAVEMTAAGLGGLAAGWLAVYLAL